MTIVNVWVEIYVASVRNGTGVPELVADRGLKEFIKRFNTSTLNGTEFLAKKLGEEVK